MKNNQKRSPLILVCLSMVLFLFSCQKEEITEHSLQTKVQPKFKIVKITNNEITENKGITEKLSFFTETLKKRKQNKTVYSSEHDFYINTDFATYIEKPNGSHTYTFAVQYAEETGEINNLVLHSKEDGTYDAIYLSYNVTENEKVLINQGLSVNLEGKISYALIDDITFIDTLFSKVTTYDECLVADYSVGPCNAGYSYEHAPEPFSGYSGGMCSGSTQTLVSVGYDMDCINDMDNNTSGGGNSNAGTGNPNGNPNDSTSNNGTPGGANAGSNNDPITTPVTCEGCPDPEELDDDCPPIPPQLISQLETVFGAGSVSLECDTPIEDAQFNSIEDLQQYFENFTNQLPVDSETIDEGNSKKNIQYFRLQTFPAAVSLKTVVRYEVPNSVQCMTLISVESSLTGNESLAYWSSDDAPSDPSYQTDYELDKVTIQISGSLKTGLKVPGFDKVVGITTSYELELRYKHTSGAFLGGGITDTN